LALPGNLEIKKGPDGKTLEVLGNIYGAIISSRPSYLKTTLSFMLFSMAMH
jgi:hypothetical protein